MTLLCGLLLATLLGGAELLSCNPACAMDELCTPVDMTFTCTCNYTMYEGSTYRDLVPTLVCDTSSMTISVSKCLLEAINRNPSASYLLDTSCKAGESSVLNDLSVYSIKTQPQNEWCGSGIKTNGTYVTYWNVLHIPPVVSNSSTAGLLNVAFSCTYTLDMQNNVPAVQLPTEQTTNLAVENSGSAPTTMTAYSNPSYTVPIKDNQDGIAVGTTLYIGIITQFTDSEMFVLRAETCYASPTANPDHPQAVLLMVGGCPANNDISTTVDTNGESFEVRFSVHVFVFQEFPELHIICNVRLCDRTGTQSCTGCSAMRSGDLGPGSGSLRLGPFTFAAYSDVSSSCHSVVSWAVLGSSLLALLSLRLM